MFLPGLDSGVKEANRAYQFSKRGVCSWEFWTADSKNVIDPDPYGQDYSTIEPADAAWRSPGRHLGLGIAGGVSNQG
jgi:hypothetical protein